MNPEFWHERWQRNEIGFHQQEINLHLQGYWREVGVDAGACVLVPLCGKSRDMLWLAGAGHRVLGVEISPLAVQAFFDENGLVPEVSAAGPFESRRCGEIEILCGDFFALARERLRDVGAVYDRASLVALPPEMRRGYAAHLTQLLAPGTPVLLVTMDYPQEQMNGPPFSVTADEVHALYDAAFDVRVLAEVDILGENPRFRERGLTRLLEQVLLLQRR